MTFADFLVFINRMPCPLIDQCGWRISKVRLPRRKLESLAFAEDALGIIGYSFGYASEVMPLDWLRCHQTSFLSCPRALWAR